MPNINAPSGLRPVGMLDGSPWNGKVTAYFVPSTDAVAMFIGDPVKLVGDSGAATDFVFGQSMEGVPMVTRASAGDALVGVVVGFSPNQTDQSVLHRPASTARIVYVADDPETVFEVQDNGTALATHAGLNANLSLGSGNTVTGQSTAQVDNATKATTSTLQVRLLGLVRRPDNELGANAKWLVFINNHQYRGTTGV